MYVFTRLKFCSAELASRITKGNITFTYPNAPDPGYQNILVRKCYQFLYHLKQVVVEQLYKLRAFLECPGRLSVYAVGNLVTYKSIFLVYEKFRSKLL
jgi:hypothetical protein